MISVYLLLDFLFLTIAQSFFFLFHSNPIFLFFLFLLFTLEQSFFFLFLPYTP